MKITYKCIIHFKIFDPIASKVVVSRCESSHSSFHHAKAALDLKLVELRANCIEVVEYFISEISEIGVLSSDDSVRFIGHYSTSSSERSRKYSFTAKSDFIKFFTNLVENNELNSFNCRVIRNV